MYHLVARIYRALDRRILCKLPSAVQRGLKASGLAAAKLVFPRKLRGLSVDAFMFSAPVKGGAWQTPVLPDWVKREMANLEADVDPLLHPLSERSAGLEFYSVPYGNERPGQVYASLRRCVKGKIDTIIVVPWLKRGGADLGALYFARALQQDLDRQVLILATEDRPSPWADKVVPGCQFLAAGAALSPCSAGEREVILARLLLQLAPRTVHIMNSDLCWRTVRRFGKAISQSSRIYASLYCDDVTADGCVDGYSRRYLVDCHQHLAGVITDNDENHRLWTRQMGVEKSFFCVVPYPAFEGDIPKCQQLRKQPSVSVSRVLWAGRLDRQKRPDVLAAIASRMSDTQFDVYGGNVIAQEAADVAMLQSLPNVRMHGAYDSFAAIVRPEHAAFVYTSQWDGMPNILLEAAVAGLPIVAPRVGGIEDFLSAAWLVPKLDDVDGYVASLSALMNNFDARAQRLDAQWSRLQQSRSWQHFVAAVQGIPDYLAAARQPSC